MVPVIGRRQYLALLAGALVWPHASFAQNNERLRRIGVLIFGRGETRGSRTPADSLRTGLQQHGWIENRTFRIEAKFETNPERIRSRAGELVGSAPDIIVVNTNAATTAVKQLTQTIPVVFAGVGDPVASGLVTSLNRPGGNVTGITNLFFSLGGKWLELLKEIAPDIARVALLFNPATAPFVEYWLGPFKAAAASFGLEAIAAPVRDRSELAFVIAAQAHEPNGGLIAIPDTFLATHRAEITSLAARYRLPAVYGFRYFAAVGGLMSYGSDQIDDYQRAAAYADRILKGTKPSELPVQTPVKFELVINLKTAKALGLVIPQAMLTRADEVIE